MELGDFGTELDARLQSLNSIVRALSRAFFDPKDGKVISNTIYVLKLGEKQPHYGLPGLTLHGNLSKILEKSCQDLAMVFILPW